MSEDKLFDTDPICNDDTEEERIEKLRERARVLDNTLTGEDWIEEKFKELWENPDGFEEGKLLSNKPEEADDFRYIMFSLAIIYGISYERYYPISSDKDFDE